MSTQARPSPGPVILLDALGTLVELVEPYTALARELACRGAAVTVAQAQAALSAEMTYYRAHHDEAVDGPSLDGLRDRCTEVLRAALPGDARALRHADLREALLGSLRFRAFAEVPEALVRLRSQGARLAIVSNWDVSLHAVLAETGLAALVDAVLTSAEERVAKPDPEIFARALERLGGAQGRAALHVGDSVAFDVGGARAAGITPVLLDRGASGPAPSGVQVIGSLGDLRLPAR